MRNWIALALLVFIAAAGGIYWGVLSAGTRWVQIAPGLEMRTLHAPVGEGAIAVTAIRTTPERVQIAVGAATDAAGWRQRTGARVAINGGFFDAGGRSLGLRVSNGRRVASKHAADWGIFVVQRGRAYVVHTRDYKLGPGVTQAVQCGPRLVVKGRVTDLKRQYARRTGIGVQRDGKVVLAVADRPLSLTAWAAMWAARDGLNCRDALNLDGGGSTQLSLRAGHHALDIGGSWPVPDAIVVK
jgi:exopolysaccharide biosynthesis protein